jgi:hypothetical protein
MKRNETPRCGENKSFSACVMPVIAGGTVFMAGLEKVRGERGFSSGLSPRQMRLWPEPEATGKVKHG